jgi:AP-3 complex subunit mu
VLLEKHYRGIVNRAGVEFFWEEVMKRAKRDDVPPVLVSPKYYLASIFRDGVYLLALVTGELPALFVLEFLHKVYAVYLEYFGEVNARAITAHFSTAYQLLEEMLDNGHPMITEPNALNSLIAPPSLQGKMASLLTGKGAVGETLGEGAMSVIPWRRANVAHVSNEIYFDICEEIDCIVESNGNVVANDVRGTVQCNSQMSGTPDLTLIFMNPSIIEDCSFHPCVRYARFEREQCVSFVPPDGPFQLMSYRVCDRNPQAPVFCRPELKYRDGIGRVSFTLGAKPMGARGGGTVARTATGGMGSAPVAGPADIEILDV